MSVKDSLSKLVYDALKKELEVLIEADRKLKKQPAFLKLLLTLKRCKDRIVSIQRKVEEGETIKVSYISKALKVPAREILEIREPLVEEFTKNKDSISLIDLEDLFYSVKENLLAETKTSAEDYRDLLKQLSSYSSIVSTEEYIKYMMGKLNGSSLSRKEMRQAKKAVRNGLNVRNAFDYLSEQGLYTTSSNEESLEPPTRIGNIELVREGSYEEEPQNDTSSRPAVTANELAARLSSYTWSAPVFRETIGRPTIVTGSGLYDAIQTHISSRVPDNESTSTERSENASNH